MENIDNTTSVTAPQAPEQAPAPAPAEAPASESLDSLNTVEACNKPAEIELVHPVSRVGLGIYWSVVGKDSDKYRARVRAMAEERIRRANAGLPDSTTFSEMEQKNIDSLVAASTGWRSKTHGENKISFQGSVHDFNVENARKFLMALPALRDQVQEAVNNLGNFMRG